MHHLGHPIVADKLYEGHTNLKRSDLLEEVPDDENEILIGRQALHALKLGFDHPVTGKRMEFEAPLPDDFQRALGAIREHRTKPAKKIPTHH
jgi:23S rRNA pseudouridine1911/1915/1917 synthase